MQPPAAHRIVISAGGNTRCDVPDSGGGYTFPNQSVAIDLDTGTARPLPAVCEFTTLLSPDARHAAAYDGRSLVYLDVETGASEPLADLGAQEPMLTQWSPKGTYLYWAGQRGTAGQPGSEFGVFVSTADGGDTHKLGLTAATGGIPGGLTWTTDETRVLANREDGTWWLGAGDGTSFRQLTSVGSGFLAMSPDGLRFAFPADPAAAVGGVGAQQIAVGDGFATPMAVTQSDPAATMWTPAWLPDGSALASVASSANGATHRPAVLEMLDSTDLHVRARFELPAIGAPSDHPAYSVKVSPDGRYVAVSRLVVTHTGQGDQYHEWFVIVRVSDGEILPRGSQRPPELTDGDGWTKASLSGLLFSPDSRRVVYEVPFSFQVVDLDGQGYRHIGLSDIGTGAWDNQLVWSAEP
jgi:hypothetical protein